MDKLEQLITEIHARFDALTGGTTEFSIGDIGREEAQAPPRISWTEPEGEFGPAEWIGGIEGTIGVQVCHCEVAIWHRDREQARNALHNLIVATNEVAYGPNVEWKRYTVPTDMEGAYAKLGWLIIATVEIKLPIAQAPSAFAEVQATEHSVVLGIMWGGFDWGGAAKYGGTVVC